jgi:glycosyltransferase involved in cell wall biosynthesis
MEQELRTLFPRARTRTVHNGTDVIPNEIQNTPRPHSLRGKLVVFSCGAFCERKGFPLLIDAFAPVAAQHENAVLRIAGDGLRRPDVEARIRAHRLEGRVELLGFHPHSAVLQEMVWSDLFALIGWDEPFATVFSEAFSAGRPVVCCNDGGINDVLENGVHGVTVPPRNVHAASEALKLLAGDAALRQRMGTSARRLFESHLTWDRNAQTMKDLFAEAVAARPLAATGAI